MEKKVLKQKEGMLLLTLLLTLLLHRRETIVNEIHRGHQLLLGRPDELRLCRHSVKDRGSEI